MPTTTIRTEVRGLDLSLEEDFLVLSHSGEDVIAAVPLNPETADRLRLEMAKALLPEWNQLEESKKRAAGRYRHYLASWLAMCIAAFTAYVSYPQYVLCLLLSLFSLFLWWRTGYLEKKSEREARAQRNAFRADWFYLQGRLQERDGEHPGMSP